MENEGGNRKKPRLSKTPPLQEQNDQAPRNDEEHLPSQGKGVYRQRIRERWKNHGKELQNFRFVEDLKERPAVRKLVEVTYKSYLDEAEAVEDERVSKLKKAFKGTDKKFSRRPCDVAFRMMRDKGLERFPEKVLGHVPGIAIGDTFPGRAIAHLAGLHKQSQAGIDSVLMTGGAAERIATSIIVSGQYEDDKDYGDYLIYTGKGGCNLLSDKRQNKDQKLIGSNLALAMNALYSVPVRVSRKTGNGRDEVVIRYDGLYDVKKFTKECGANGYLVCKYELVRCPGQKMMSKQAGLITWEGSKNPCMRFSRVFQMVCRDISFGAEDMPVSAVNDVDRMLPPGIKRKHVPEDSLQQKKWKEDSKLFHYTTKMSYGRGIQQLNSPPRIWGPGPDHERVTDLNKLPKGMLPYRNGRLQGVSGILYECGPHMQCPNGKSCSQAVSQSGIKLSLQLFKTADRGWAVRTLEPIPAMMYVCTYIGVVKHAGDTGVDDYAIELCRRRDYDEDGKFVEDGTDVDVKYIVTGVTKGNIFRYINHSCDPNLFVQPVLDNHFDRSRPKIALYSLRMIKPYEELTYDYGRGFLQDRKLKCKCGAAICLDREIEFDK